MRAGFALALVASLSTCTPAWAAQTAFAPRAESSERTPSSAIDSCGPRAVMLARIAEEWGERPVFAGLTVDGTVIEIVAVPGGGWTALHTVGQQSCIVGAGPAWTRPAPPAGRES
ncbi:MAG: hypothetical protein FJX46_00225 [Alphaproteobacteria bacterium]|nr:hypothetical protein [Alphaproteobacteria bacterium]